MLNISAQAEPDGIISVDFYRFSGNLDRMGLLTISINCIFKRSQC